jgi:hypothetical protein
MQPDYAANMWNEALNKRLGTKVLYPLDLFNICIFIIEIYVAFVAVYYKE